MKFLIYSKCGEGAGLGLRLQNEGNEVRLFIKEREYRSVYKGILEQTLPRKLDGDTILVFDSSGFGSEADEFKKQGLKVFGGSRFADVLELDRRFGLLYMRRHGIKIPETVEFHGVGAALGFLKEKDKEYVFKPSGDLPSKLTYKPCDAEDLVRYLEFVGEEYDVEDFILQEVVEGVAISTEYWVGSKGFIGPPNHTIEVKKFMDKDLGPSTGCSGNTVWATDEDDPIAKLLRNCEKDLVKEGYVGPIDLNVIVTPDGIYGLEWTPRFGLDAMPTLLQLLPDVGRVISDCVSGSTDKMKIGSFFASGLRVSIPPYPIEPETLTLVNKESPNYGVPIRGFDGYEENIYFYEICRDEAGRLYHSDGTGAICVISDVGDSIHGSFSLPYHVADGLKIPEKQYRTDLSEVIEECYEEVTESLEKVNA